MLIWNRNTCTTSAFLWILPHQRLVFAGFVATVRVIEEPLRNYLFIFWIFFFTVLLQILLPLYPPPPLSLCLPPSLSLFVSLSPAKGEQKRWFLHHPSSRHLRLDIFFFISLSFLLNEMIQFPTEVCRFFCCGGGALFLVGRFNCPQALPVGNGDSYQNSCHMKLLPATFNA